MKNKKNIILAEAYKLFSEFGFAGTSIKMIAEKLEIPTSLIFHHFKSKENLWVSTEIFAIEQCSAQVPHTFREDTLKNFLEDFINYRLELYKCREFRRLFQWRSLEKNTQKFMNITKAENPAVSEPMNIMILGKRLQNNGLIRQDIDLSIIAMSIFVHSSYAVFDYMEYYNIDQEKIEEFKITTINSLLSILTPITSKEKEC